MTKPLGEMLGQLGYTQTEAEAIENQIEAECAEAEAEIKAQAAPPPSCVCHDPDVPQVGGDHYAEGEPGEQHWERQWRKYGPAWFIGSITKYAERAHLKGGLEDLDKALTYVRKYRALLRAWIDGTGSPPGQVNLDLMHRAVAEAAAVRERQKGMTLEFFPIPDGPPKPVCPRCGSYAVDELVLPPSGRIMTRCQTCGFKEGE